MKCDNCFHRPYCKKEPETCNDYKKLVYPHELKLINGSTIHFASAKGGKFKSSPGAILYVEHLI